MEVEVEDQEEAGLGRCGGGQPRPPSRPPPFCSDLGLEEAVGGERQLREKKASEEEEDGEKEG